MKSLFTFLSLATLSILCGSCQKDVQPKPVANFTYYKVKSSNTETLIIFANTSSNADRYQWTTNTGAATSEKNFTYSVTSNGRNVVSLTAKNDAGEDTKTESIDITDLVTTGQFMFYTSVGDKGDISIYINNTLQGKINKYYSSGAPSCGEQGSVTVTLNPGSYNFTAKSEGLIPVSWSGTINVVRGQCNSTRLTK